MGLAAADRRTRRNALPAGKTVRKGTTRRRRERGAGCRSGVGRREVASGDVVRQLAAAVQPFLVLELVMNASVDPAAARLLGGVPEAGEGARRAGGAFRADGEAEVVGRLLTAAVSYARGLPPLVT